MSSTTPARVSVTNQPQANVELDFKQPMMSINEKSFEDSLENDQYHEEDHDCQHHHRRQASSSEHNSCHNNRLRQFLLPGMIALFALGGILAWSCVHSSINNWNWGVDELVRRAITDTTGNGNTFIHNKLYIIVIVVGLFVVLVLGIMLSAWCCKGSFRNPLCCPCYLCACCGGLACLECIACGLCADAV